MESLNLALDVLDRAEEVARNNESLNANKEARRLLRDHPEADVSEDEVATLIREEVDAGRRLGLEGDDETGLRAAGGHRGGSGAVHRRGCRAGGK